MGAALGLSEPQAFENYFLANNGLSNKHFSSYLLQQIVAYHIQVFDVGYERSKWKRYSVTASTFCFHIPV